MDFDYIDKIEVSSFMELSSVTCEKHKNKINSIIEQRGLCSMMNTTKWKELKLGVSELPFEPPFVIKELDEEETEYHKFDKDIYNSMDWGLYLEDYIGGDIYAVQYFAVEWIKVRPRMLQKQSKLIGDKIIDETEEFIAKNLLLSCKNTIFLMKK